MTNAAACTLVSAVFSNRSREVCNVRKTRRFNTRISVSGSVRVTNSFGGTSCLMLLTAKEPISEYVSFHKALANFPSS